MRSSREWLAPIEILKHANLFATFVCRGNSKFKIVTIMMSVTENSALKGVERSTGNFIITKIDITETLFSVHWSVHGYRWVTSIFNFSAPRMQGPARDSFCIPLVPVVDVVAAFGEAENRITTSLTGIRDPRTNRPQTKSSAGSFDRGTSNKTVKSTAKRPSKFSQKSGTGGPFLSWSKVT